jgi:hypothetical protein
MLAGIFDLQFVSQVLEPPGESRVDGACSDSEEVTDLGRRQVEPVAKHQDEPAFLGKRAEGIRELLEAFVDGSEAVARRLERFGPAPLLPERIQGLVDDDPMKPGREGAATVEARDPAICALERLLRCIVGKRPAFGDGEGESPGRLPVALEELGSSGARAAACAARELRVSHPSHDIS